MAVIKHTKASALVPDAIVLDLGDLEQQGKSIIERAEREAVRLKNEAQQQATAHAETIREAARAEGYERGHQEGMEAGRAAGHEAALEERRAEFDQLLAGWTETADHFERARIDLIHGAQRDLIQLAITIAERITHRAIELYPDTVVDQVAGVIDLLMRPGKVKIIVHPEDEPLVEQALPGLIARKQSYEHIEIVQDGEVNRGGCLLRTEQGSIDAGVDTQVARIAEALLPSAGAPALHGHDGDPS